MVPPVWQTLGEEKRYRKMNVEMTAPSLFSKWETIKTVKMFFSVISIIPEKDKVNKYEDGWLLVMQWQPLTLLHWRTMFHQSWFYMVTGKSITIRDSKNLRFSFKMFGSFPPLSFFLNWRRCSEMNKLHLTLNKTNYFLVSLDSSWKTMSKDFQKGSSHLCPWHYRDSCWSTTTFPDL